MRKRRQRFSFLREARVLLVALLLPFAVPGLGADIRNGDRLYHMHCANCHGVTGTPEMPGAPDLRRGQVLLRPDALILQSIKRGRGAMPGYFGILTDRELLDVIAHMRTLM